MDYVLFGLALGNIVVAMVCYKSCPEMAKAALLFFAIYIVGFSIVEAISNQTIEVTATSTNTSAECHVA